MTIGEFKERVASVVVGDEPWDTSLVWADAQIDLPELDEVERARVVVDLLVELLDDGLVEYFVVSNFNVEEYEKDPAPSELLTRHDLRDHLSRKDSLLRMRPTETARRRYSPRDT